MAVVQGPLGPMSNLGVLKHPCCEALLLQSNGPEVQREAAVMPSGRDRPLGEVVTDIRPTVFQM